MPLQRYAEFSGRSRRKEYWLFSLACVLVYSALGALLFVGGSDGGDITSMSGVVGLTFLALILAILVPSLAVQVRRFHDQDGSGWFML